MNSMTVVTLTVAALFAANNFAYGAKNSEANKVSNTRAKTAARAESVVEKKPVSEPQKGGYHVGADTRYQPSKRDESVTKLSGGKDKHGKYKSTAKQ